MLKGKIKKNHTHCFVLQNFVDDVKQHERDLKEVNRSGEDFLHEAKVFLAFLGKNSVRDFVLCVNCLLSDTGMRFINDVIKGIQI